MTTSHKQWTVHIKPSLWVGYIWEVNYSYTLNFGSGSYLIASGWSFTKRGAKRAARKWDGVTDPQLQSKQAEDRYVLSEKVTEN